MNYKMYQEVFVDNTRKGTIHGWGYGGGKETLYLIYYLDYDEAGWVEEDRISADNQIALVE